MLVLSEKITSFFLGMRGGNNATAVDNCECNYVNDYYGDQICIPVRVEADRK